MIPRRWPVVTLTIIVLCLLVFLATHDRLNQEAAEHAQIESRIVRLAALRPSIPLTPAQQALVNAFRRTQPDAWDSLGSPSRNPSDTWEVEMRGWTADQARQQVAQLGQQLAEFERTSLIARYSLYPPKRASLRLLTASFLHRNWAHLMFNLCFLCLAGTILEDVWGRPVFLGFYLLAGAASVWAYSIVYPAALIPPMGASGTVAAVMAAFLVRFPRTRISRGTALWSVRPRLFRLSSPVYLVFPLFLVGELIWGNLVGESGAAPYWAQGGAFSFGFVFALVMRLTGMSDHLDAVIESRVCSSADPHIARAVEYMEKGQIDSAISAVRAQLAEKPASEEAHDLLVRLCLRKGDIPTYLRALEERCELRIKMSYPEGAWQDYQDYIASGGRKMPPDTWLELGRIAETQEGLERAVREYEELAQAWPDERASVLALMAAGRVYLQMGRQEDARRCYTAAKRSPVPHADWDETIRKGLEKAGGELPSKTSPRTASAKSRDSKQRSYMR